MLTWMEGLYEGAWGRFLRAALATGLGVLASHYQSNEWYVALGPALQLIGKKLRDRYAGKFDWLPF